MKYRPVNLARKFDLVDAPWSPRIIAEMNDYPFKVVPIRGDFLRHDHPATDETFIVLDGGLRIESRDGEVTPGSGERLVVPAGAEHRPCAQGELKLLLIEPRGAIDCGDARGGLNARGDQWI